MNTRLILFLACLGAAPLAAAADAIPQSLDDYRAAGATQFSAERGAALWRQEVIDAKSGQARACTTCHGDDLHQAGKHARTSKPIAPMVPSAANERLQERRKIAKWFLRNCKWTWGRECTPQERGDILAYIQQQ